MKRILLLLIAVMLCAVFVFSQPTGPTFFTGLIKESSTELREVRYAFIAKEYSSKYFDLIAGNPEKLSEFVIMNPPVYGNPQTTAYMNFFIKLLLPLYVIAIAVIGSYLIFFSGSPEGRASAKSSLMKLLIVLIVVSFSPVMMEIFLSITGYMAGSILSLVDISYVVDALEDYVGFLSMIGIVAAFILGPWSFYFFGPLLLVVWGLFAILYVRYLIVTLLVILLPLSVSLYALNFTRSFGRVLMEQTILWSFLQVINAVVIAVIAVALASRPENFMIVEMVPPFPPLDFITLLGAVSIVAAPIVTLTWLRGILP